MTTTPSPLPHPETDAQAPDPRAPLQHVPVPVAMSADEQRTWSILIHLSPFAASLIGLPFLGPLIGYLLLRDRGDYVRFHTAQALNLQLTSLIATVAAGILCFVIIGFPLLIAVGIATVVLQIVAAVKASRGEFWVIPATIRFVR